MTEEEEKAIAADARYAKFADIRDDPAHHVIIAPLEKKSVEVVESFRMRGSVEVDYRDAVTGKVIARAQHCAPVDADSGIFESTRVSRAYFLKGSSEDAVAFSNNVLTTLRDLVNRAYQTFP